jgi:hypothetical protein
MPTIVNSFGWNGVTGSFQPTTHGWVPRSEIGIDGNGHAVYPSVREYQLEWDFLSAAEFNTLYGYFLATGATGTIVSMLPKYPPIPSYSFHAYSGTVLREPTFKDFFENYYTDVKLLIVKILT